MGKPDDWDALTILPTMPVLLKDEIRLYYGGSTERKVDFRTKPLWVTKPGVALLRRDGFTAMTIKPTLKQGFLLTIPFPLTQQSNALFINADCNGGQIRVGLIDSQKNSPITGYAVEDCVPLQSDQQSHRVIWNTNRTLPAKSQHVRLKFEFQRKDETPRLFAYWFQTVK